MRDLFVEIWGNVRRNKLRTSLTGFAVAWGIFMLIFLLGAGNGLINGLTSNSRGYLPNSMEVYGGVTSKGYQGLKEGRYISLKDSDLDILRGEEFSANVEEAAAILRQASCTVSNGEYYYPATVNGVDPAMARINKISVLYGRFINGTDVKERRKVIVLDSDNARELLGITGQNEDNLTELEKAAKSKALIGKNVKIGSSMYKVVGIVRRSSGSDGMTYIPITTLKTIYSKGDKIDSFSFSFNGLETAKDNEEFEDRLRSSLNTNHSAAPDDESAVFIWNNFTMTMNMNTAMNMIRTALWIIGILTLLSGIVGVSNIMLISVKERTHEFGIRKSLGARPWSLLKMIISESIVITAFFGYIGMFLGMIANEILNHFSGNMSVDMGIGEKMSVFKDSTVGLGVCIGVTVVLIVAGTLAGMIPARKAAKVRPIEALREGK